ncbi:2-oxo-tetronate isomerase [Comamonas terrigena]|jgi:hydroxypyruvate isomerase|uniref:2-oxo-tetronate isomerase n=1 Tax=Comamonas terrigena TaxID=32013 RepID=UPI00244967FC|nr:2-oxo-tetronate isomerase [Comamonas terrigena]MDH0048717.1 hydroxypyruvate isomerase family protein [Comamonas terrigena]MDH0511697.1 hydroxypyruvate isomerase family protein [Comamonas terrigena]MDH1090845.1 hydroxypyruvate isomerase family protein [Comamonas terrigena]
MPQFAANLSLMYTELPFLERFAAAARDGFRAVEYLFPYAHAPAQLAQQLRAHGLQQVLFNAPPGGTTRDAMATAWDAGARGTLCLAGQDAAFRAGLQQALEYASVLQCPRVHVMGGLLPAGQSHAGVQALVTERLHWAAQQAQDAGVALLIEPINGRDMPGYYLQRQDQAHALVQAVDSPRLQVQMDLYHCQIVEGDVAMKLRHYLPTGRVGHIQIAGVPDRHEPDSGELHYPYLFDVLDQLGYTGWVGCEYRPRAGTSQGLGWLQAYARTDAAEI